MGFNFTKMSAERMEHAMGKIGISNNVAIKNIEKSNLPFTKTKEEGVKFSIEFVSKYENEAKKPVAMIVVSGDVMYLDDGKNIKKLLEGWKKDKQISPEIMQQVLNTALSRCNVQALILSKDLNIPPPVPLPKVNVKTG